MQKDISTIFNPVVQFYQILRKEPSKYYCFPRTTIDYRRLKAEVTKKNNNPSLLYYFVYSNVLENLEQDFQVLLL